MTKHKCIASTPEHLQKTLDFWQNKGWTFTYKKDLVNMVEIGFKKEDRCWWCC